MRREEQSSPQLQEKEKISLETIALQTELDKTEEPIKTEEKLSSVSTITSQKPNLLVQNSLEDNKLFSSGFGETSFSAAEADSGHITYSGPVAFSGSLSVRSDTSTPSGRSFAFPVTSSEWPKRTRKDKKDGETFFSAVDSLDQFVPKLFTLKHRGRRLGLFIFHISMALVKRISVFKTIVSQSCYHSVYQC
ncbi:unnamed protein product [Eruca vesicaria subsp. sativa]|uniref:Uncharacterized protein n=1 Tax=Eruca vesicaria subsp. sativa TaxID=29727 RepID=A0ABC8LC34_ERUVS|nr:unnamed protein product [Eruca vesicaria subsp. sativa]